MLESNQDIFQLRPLKREIQRVQKQNFPVPVRFSLRRCSKDEIINIPLIYRNFYVKKKEREVLLCDN